MMSLDVEEKEIFIFYVCAHGIYFSRVIIVGVHARMIFRLFAHP